MLATAGFAPGASADVPNRTYRADQLYQIISPQMGASDHNQPSIVDGLLLIAGNATHEVWDIADPFRPVLVSEFQGPHHDGEAESHQIAFARYPDGRRFAVSTSGLGVDLWDLTDMNAPALLSAFELEGIAYGDNTEAVWGLFWQGDYIYVGGTNTGLHVVDARDPSNPSLVTRLPTSALGGVSAGPLFALGNLLVVTTPKDVAGLATVDIGDPANPAVLDFDTPPGASYIGGFYGSHAYLLTPFRTYDVTSDPSNIQLMGSVDTERVEYMSFGDGFLFLGALRPNPGIFKIPLESPNTLDMSVKIEGREGILPLNDDQFSIPVGNLVVISDDELDMGTVLAVHDTARDSTPPTVQYVNPKPGATNQPVTTRIGLSFSDQIDFESVDPSTLVVRPVGGAAPLSGKWGHIQTLVSFWPDEPLEPETTYEIVIPAGGITDLVGNPIADDFTSAFSTGAMVSLPTCEIADPSAAPAGEAVLLEANPAAGDATYTWEFGDGSVSPSEVVSGASHEYQRPGRYPVTLTVETASGSRSCSTVQVVHRQLTAASPTRSTGIFVDEERGRAWVVNPDANTVSAIDTTTLVKSFEVPVGEDPRTLAQAPDGSIWVANHGSSNVSVLDPTTGGVDVTIGLPYGSQPYGVVFSPDGEAAYVTLQATGQILRIDPVARCVVSSLSVGPDIDGVVPQIRGAAVTADSRQVFVTRFVSPRSHGEIYSADARLSLVRRHTLSKELTPDEKNAGRGVPNYVSSLAISPDGLRIWVPSKKDNTDRGLVRDGEALNTDNTVRTVVSQLEIGGTELHRSRIDIDNHDMAFAATSSPKGDVVFVTSQGTNQVDVFDAYEGRLLAGFSVGLAPRGLVLDDAGRLFVQNFMSRSVSVFDVSGLLSGLDNSVRPLAEVDTVDNELLTEEVRVGKQIFYNADSPQMSQDGYVSCASCHLDGGQDGRVWDFTDRGEGLRNTITLRGRAGVGHGPVHWTGNFDEIQDFENDIRLHFGGSGLMSTEDFEAEDRAHPLGGPKAGLSAALDALAAYVSSLDDFPASPYRNQDGSFTDDALAGRAIYERLDCSTCHSGTAMTDSAVGVLHEVGTASAESGQRLGESLAGFDTPTLRGVWATAPYLHDGSATTLLEVLENPAHGNAAKLSIEDRQALVSYLLELEGPETDSGEPRSTTSFALCDEAMPRSPSTPAQSGSQADGGCACVSVGSGSRHPQVPWLLALAAALGLRRRRR